MKSTFPILCGLIAIPLHATLIVENGDFETGDLTGWTFINGSVRDTVCLDGTATSFFQNLTTTAGQYYDLSFCSSRPSHLDDVSVDEVSGSPVPEPATFGSAGAVMAGLAFAARRCCS